VFALEGISGVIPMTLLILKVLTMRRRNPTVLMKRKGCPLKSETTTLGNQGFALRFNF
jgi:hypothetical protein